MALSAVPGGFFRVTLLGAPRVNSFAYQLLDSQTGRSPISMAVVARDRLLSRAKPPRANPDTTPAADPRPVDAGPPPTTAGLSAKPPRKRPAATPVADAPIAAGAPPADMGVSMSEPPATPPPASPPPPPLSVVVVHRPGDESIPGAPPSGRQRLALGDVPMDEDPPSRSFRRVIDRLTNDIAERRDNDRDQDAS